ncbi:MAG: monovalent cation/H(+) antiporter subunit G [Antricoccus sp.]
MSQILDIAGAVFLVIGSAMCLLGAIGLVRFVDVLGRMHAATKPQTLGILSIAIGLSLTLRSWQTWTLMLLVVIMQTLTAPVAAHMVGRAAYRTGQYRADVLIRDELGEALDRAQDD